MSDNKIIIRNCPCYNNDWLIEDADTFCSYYGEDCQDCTNCLIKQIAIMCNYAIHGAKATGHFNFLGEKILGLLDIQEVE